jgi:sorbitol/mannitol transport system substrate-binding protein
VGGGDSVNVLMVNNPQMVDLQRLTAQHFTKDTGIRVNFTVLPENDVRDKISQEFSSQAGQYDVATLSNFEIPIYARSHWVAPLDDYVKADRTFDQSDILGPMTQSLTAEDGKLYGEPFYGESSFLMYRKDVLAAKGIQMPAKPTWQQVADIAAKVDHAQPGMAGICLRGQPGWGQVFAPLTTVVNTFGGTWFTKDWQAQVDSDAFRRGTQFYVNLVRSHGENGAPQAGFTECLNNLIQGKSAMWYDATSAAGSLTPRSAERSVTPRRRWSRPRTRAGCTPGPGPSSRPARRRTRPGSSSPGRPASSTRTWSAPSSAGPGCRPASAPRPTPTRST